MNRFELAVNSFFWIFLNKKFAVAVGQLFEKEKKLPEKPEAVVKEKEKEIPPKKQRNDAVQILTILQRDGRLVDFLKEPLDSYSDAQIGAAVRDIHRDCVSVLDRVFGIEPLIENEEGTMLTVMPGFDPEQYRLTGNVTGNPPFKGAVKHHGWRITKQELPVWSGKDDSVNVIAPAEIELS